MNKVLVRMLLFFIGLPLVLGLSLWDWGFYLPLAVVAIVVCCFGADETAALLRRKDLQLDPVLPFFLGLLFPSLAYLENAHWINTDQTLVAVSVVIFVILIRQIFANTEEHLQPVMGKVAGIVFALIYPGLFLYYFLKINSLPDALLLTPIFLMATFGNDAWAWMFGTLWGKTSPKPFLVSPSKSLVGFAGGIIANFLVLIVAFFLFPGVLGRNFWMLLLLGLILGVTTIVGDLFESTLKRSAGVKDSGNLIPGRGGVLDSIDSLLFSAPVFYLFLQYGRF